MITLDHVYVLAGVMFAAVALLSVRDKANPKRIRTGLFWGLLALSFLIGGQLSDLGNGVLVIGLALLAGFGGLGKGAPVTTTPEERRASAEKRGDGLFLPALIIPVTALAGTFVFKTLVVDGHPVVDPKQATLISLALGVMLALSAAMLWLRPKPSAPLQEGRRLLDTIGWAAILPQMLASLGAVFALNGVGDAVGQLVGTYLPLDTPIAAVAAYCLGMALFTVVMGNAFAAFPVMTAAVGLPLIVGKFGGDPAVVGAIGMLSGFCGTLLTPMAANFNVVPANLLELPDRNAVLNGVIRAQIPTALPLLAVNVLLMYLLAFR
ncbi:DUF979 domain-containing protein [Caulobacter sp. 17J65-9]|uniref:DUF979 domain-containing protein n=1 Tax=Caulobacter sp. 17J65-9 TaxID=2709382 RepID=UPI0013CA4553|nr:DUF979 domain-containing protein [Caulobacter sp. 17J65-9]NEX91796.1 DUF979 domain-containing protein [Caulobacter sp. 17J65-9]